MSHPIFDTPRSLRSVEAIADRRQLLAEPHIAPLAHYVERLLVKHPTWEFQDFDPLDGGVNADILFLLEKPGPMTSPSGRHQGSGFISRNNDDPTAEAIFDFMIKANIPRKRTALWNVIPGWNGVIKTTASELHSGANELKDLLPLLPKVKTVVLIGRKAERVRPLLQAMNLRVFTSAHPSPKVRAINKHLWDLIPQQWTNAGKT